MNVELRRQPTKARHGKRRFDRQQAFGVISFGEHHLDGDVVFVAPDVPAWITVAASDAHTIRRVLNGDVLADIEDEVGTVTLSDSLARLVAAGFLNDRVAPADPLARPAIGRRVQFQLTNKCNLRCTHCYMSSGEPLPDEAVEPGPWINLLDLLHDRYGPLWVSFSGGEPLVSPLLWPVLGHARQLKSGTAIITNGTRLNPEVAERLEPLLDYCAISLDGVSAATHDLIRGVGSFDKTYRNLVQLGRYRFKKVLNFTIMSTNVDEMVASLPDFVRELPFEVDVDLGAVIAEGRGEETGGTLALPDAQFRAALQDISARLVSRSSQRPSGALNDAPDSSGRWRSLPVRPKYSCGYADTLAVYADGGFSTCLTPRFIRGNAFDGTSSDSTPVRLRGQRASLHERRFNRGAAAQLLDRVDAERSAVHVGQLEECRTCDFRLICGGQCHLGQVSVGEMPTQVECSDGYKRSVLRNLASWRSSG